MSRFVDFTTIFLRSGCGGNGIVSFCRERYRPMGGPDGGDGGVGGSIICQLDRQRNSLEHLTHQRHYRAGDGGHGKGGSRHGANGDDCVVLLPLGAVVRPHGEKSVLCEITDEAPRFVLLHGGRGGYGNTRFKTAHNRAPRFAQDGGEAESIQVDVELCLMADIGLLGLPNAGKSSLLRAVSKASPLVADYPFTSLMPTLGVVDPPLELRAHQPLTVVDVPGVIEGAASGRGLGNRFLRHLSRARVIAYTVSLMPLDGLDAVEQLTLLERELRSYDSDLLSRVALVVANKVDCRQAAAEFAKLTQAAVAKIGPDIQVVSCSATQGTGVDELRGTLYRCYDKMA